VSATSITRPTAAAERLGDGLVAVVATSTASGAPPLAPAPGTTTGSAVDGLPVLAATGVAEVVCAVIDGVALTTGGVSTVADSVAAALGVVPLAVPVIDVIGFACGGLGRAALGDGVGVWTSWLGKTATGGPSASSSVTGFGAPFVLHGSDC